MSILIRGVYIDDVSIADYCEDGISLKVKVGRVLQGVNTTAELVKALQGICEEVPTPHGQLIDALKEMKQMQSYDFDTYEDYSRAFDILDCAPTVIEAEV